MGQAALTVLKGLLRLLRWVGSTVLRLAAHGGTNASTPRDAQELYRRRPDEYRP